MERVAATAGPDDATFPQRRRSLLGLAREIAHGEMPWFRGATVASLCLILSGCVQLAPALDPDRRFPTLDAAALAAAAEIQRRTGKYRYNAPVEWSFNICRDGEGYHPAAFYTDHNPFYVWVRIPATAVAAGHSHWGLSTCTPFGRRCVDPDDLSEWDKSESGVLGAQRRVGRLLPHYLVTQSGRVRVWEWQDAEQIWAVREVPRPRQGRANK